MKKFLCILVTLMLLFFFLLSPGEALAASRRGLALWFDQLLPALLPFTVLSYVILQSNLFFARSGRRPQKGISPEEWYVILCGFLFGFPIGSKLTADLYRQGRLSPRRAQVLFVFSNNLSPVFVTTVLTELLDISPGLATYALLYGIPLAYGLIALHLLPTSSPSGQKNTASRFRLNMQIIDAGILNGFETLIKICGYIVLFSLFAQLLLKLPIGSPVVKTLLIGLTEVTTGMSQLSSLPEQNLNYILGIGFITWGGISGFFQTASIVSGTDLSMKRYLLIRLMLTSLAVLCSVLLCVLRVR